MARPIDRVNHGAVRFGAAAMWAHCGSRPSVGSGINDLDMEWEYALIRPVTEEKLLEQIGKMEDRIATEVVRMSDRDKTKDVALGTSK